MYLEKLPDTSERIGVTVSYHGSEVTHFLTIKKEIIFL